MDFYKIKERSGKGGVIEIYPDYRVCRSKDLMVRGKAFYAIYDEDSGLWSTDEYDVQRLLDHDLTLYLEEARKTRPETVFNIKWLSDFSSGSWNQFKKYVTLLADNAVQLDQKVTYLSQKVSRKDYASKRLPYDLDDSTAIESSAYGELISTLYDPEERQKIEWAIGAIISGDSCRIQKFITLYGEAGSGKSTILNIIEQLFGGYCTFFDGKALTSANNQFALETLKNGPLVAIQHDADLSKIEDNTRLNSIVSHEEMTVNEKYKSAYSARFSCFLFLASNKPVRITDAKSGLIRRLIDVHPSGRRIQNGRYNALIERIPFELGAIAKHCETVYNSLGPNYYYAYRPVDMMFKTDTFFNFIEANYPLFKEQNGVSLKQAYDIYKQYCDEALVELKLPRHKFREELKNYFERFDDVADVDGRRIRSYFSGFLSEKFKQNQPNNGDVPPKSNSWIKLEPCERPESNVLNLACASCKAQYATEDGIPSCKWERCSTTLDEIDTRKLHYVKVPENHIVIDFDLKNEKGEKDLEANLAEASLWPKTYCECSRSEAGLHLHYIYEGDAKRLRSIFKPWIEIKQFGGNSALRRRVSRCNDLPIAKLSSGLPLKEDKVVDFKGLRTEKSIRRMIERNLRKEIHGYTKPSIDFIYDILEDAYKQGVKYDVSDMRPAIMSFANGSSHNGDYCIQKVLKMKFCSEENYEDQSGNYSDERLVFFDCEVFPNLFLVNYKVEGTDKVIRLINPSPQQIEELMQMKLIGFNCRRYDNHILYARYMGYDNQQLATLSQRIINGNRSGYIREAYNVSYADIYEFASKRQSLKKWEIELGLHHQEMDLPWDKPVPEAEWARVAEYCDNDVLATEALFYHIKADWDALHILAKLSGLPLNESIRKHAAKIIFGDDKHPQDKFVYTDLSEIFPGYQFYNGKSYYMGEEPGEGGYVYAEPGMYSNAALLDIASMHPTSIECLNLFGPYTSRFSDIKRARIAVKHRDFDSASSMFGGALAPFLNEELADSLSYALKIIINKVYGFTSATFDNEFRDPRNIDNIVAKRGALFMINLKHEVQKRGFTVAHIKTDSIKIPNATDEIIKFVMDYGQQYGYTFEHEATYDRMCLVNDAVYIAKYKGGKHDGEWTATGAQFQHPVVFKTLFSHEELTFEDYCETKTVTSGTMYLDMNEALPEGEHNYIFVGRAGLFVPIIDGAGGGVLYREKDGKYYSVTGTKGYRWLEAETVKALHKENDIDISYSSKLVMDAIHDISKYGDFKQFEDSADSPPWLMPCGDFKIEDCAECRNLVNGKCSLGYDISNVIK